MLMGVFIENKYYRWYIALTERAKGRVLGKDVYTEAHHILPKCMNGDNSKENLVKLTCRQHFIAHLLLTKCTTGKNKSSMYLALWRMIHGQQGKLYIINSRLYEKIKQIMLPRLRTANLGKKHSLESRAKMSAKQKGKHKSEEAKRNMSIAKKGMKYKPQSDEHKRKIGAANKGKKRPDIDKMRERSLRYHYEVTYPDGKKVIINNLTEFARANGLDQSQSRKVAFGKAHQHHKFKFKIIGEIEHG
jgi:hypothetical protein